MKTTRQLSDILQERPEGDEIQWVVLDKEGNIISASIRGEAQKTRALLTAISDLKTPSHQLEGSKNE